jgi:hypothetical protein
MPNILEQLPNLVLYVVAGAIIFVIVGYILAAKRPATKGQIIGHYTFHVWGIDSIEGLTSLGQDILQDEAFTKLFWVGTKKANPGLSGDEFAAFKAALQKFHVYGVRKGVKKFLIVTNQNIRTPEVGEAPPSERRKFSFPHGWLDKVHVYGPGKGPLNFKGYSVYVMAPVDIMRGQPDFKTFQAMENIGKAVGVIQVGMPTINEYKALTEQFEVLNDQYKKALSEIAEFKHENSILREALAQKPLGAEPKATEAKVFQFPRFRFSLIQLALTFAAFAVGAFTLPNYYKIEAFTAGIILAAPTFLIVGFLKKR